MVLHSVKSDEAIDSSKTPEHAKFVKIGLYSVDWVQSLRPTISDFPPYADESGLDQIYVAVSPADNRSSIKQADF
jgi:hypothetical protein